MQDLFDRRIDVKINLGITGSIIAMLALIGGAQIIRWVEQSIFKSKGKEKT